MTASSLYTACDLAKIHGQLTSSSLGKGSLAANSSRRALRNPWSTFRFISWISTLKYLSSTKSTRENTLKQLIRNTCLVQNQTNQKKHLLCEEYQEPNWTFSQTSFLFESVCQCASQTESRAKWAGTMCLHVILVLFLTTRYRVN